MKKTTRYVLGIFVFLVGLWNIAYSSNQTDPKFSLKNLEGSDKITLSIHSRDLLERIGFAVSPGDEKEIYDIYTQAKKRNQPIFVTTDAVLHTCHIFFDYLLRILEMEKLYPLVADLTDRMITASQVQYEEATQENVKEAARLNIGFFSVAKKILTPTYEPGFQLAQSVDTELQNIDAHKGLEFRALLSYIKNPTVFETPYAYEDFSQYVPRGHYTRNETFEKYFKVMMWYGRMDFKLKPGEKDEAVLHGKLMTLQALLIADALVKDEKAYQTWRAIYEPTVYFVGKTDDLSVDDYTELIPDVFAVEGSVDRYGDEDGLSHFIEKALKLQPPRILSGAAFVEDGEFAATNKGFRFMGQRFIPDSYMFQELVYGRRGDKVILRYTGKGKPFTMEVLPAGGPARAFPRGLDIMAVLGSERALAILEQEGDTEYTYYDDQLNKLKQEFSALSPDEWKQNLYWRWLYCLLPLLEEKKEPGLPEFMKSELWIDKELQTTLGSWTELRHDTILYAKQSYTMMTRALPPQPELTYGYVEPYPGVYRRIHEMMADMRKNLTVLGILIPGIPEKIREFEEVLGRLAAISQLELTGKELDKRDYELIWNIGGVLSSLKQFPSDIMAKITSDADERMDIIADVHTDLNTKQVLEEGVGSPFDIFVIVEDPKGTRLCRGGVFSYYEFKHPMDDRLTDEKWQEMGKQKKRPAQPPWTQTFITKF
jgi:hypothetical protein